MLGIIMAGGQGSRLMPLTATRPKPMVEVLGRPVIDYVKDAMVDAGIDCFDCSTRRFWEPEFEGSDLNFAGWTKKLMGLPTITVGSVGLTGEFVAGMGGESSEAAPIDGLIERLEREEFDLVGVGRALLTDAEWPNKIREGRFDELKAFEQAHMLSLS